LAPPNSGAHCGQDQTSDDVMAEFSKWLEAPYELPEAAARTTKFQK
jgi:hypothetical protein